jgi:GLPGLI family protein
MIRKLYKSHVDNFEFKIFQCTQLLLVFFTLQISAQESNYLIDYKAAILDDKELVIAHAGLQEMYQNAVNDAPKLTFELHATKEASLFFDNAVEASDKDKILKMQIFPFLRYSGLVYSVNDSVFQKKPLYGENFYLASKNDFNWQISTQTKDIGGYKCYKAAGTKIIFGVNGPVNIPVMAYFTPSLPINAGPNGYSGLPGLILELQIKNIVFGATKIMSTTDNILPPAKFNEAKFVSASELDAIIKKEMGEE